MKGEKKTQRNENKTENLEKFNILAMQTLDTIFSVPAFANSAFFSGVSKTLLKLLKDPTQFLLYDSIVLCLFKFGKLGIQFLLEEASDASSEWDSLIL